MRKNTRRRAAPPPHLLSTRTSLAATLQDQLPQHVRTSRTSRLFHLAPTDDCQLWIMAPDGASVSSRRAVDTPPAPQVALQQYGSIAPTLDVHSSAPLPKFVIHRSILQYELRKQRGTSRSIFLVPLFDLKFLTELAATAAGTSNRRH